MPHRRSRALGLLLGYALDRAVGDPRRGHPVAGFGAVAGRLEPITYHDSRLRGVAHVIVLVGAAAGAGRAAEARFPGTAVVALCTWTVLGGRSLEREATAVHDHLASRDLPAARRQVGRLVGRATQDLDADEVARAAVESVAENTSDAVVAPLVWGALLGPAGLMGYRAANTLDAMVGHHNPRYERFGWAAARTDDLLNLPGSRLTGLLVLAADPSRARAAWTSWRRDAAAHPSPNGGVVESAFAGSLGIRLGGTNTYDVDRVEHRAVMGDGRPAQAQDIAAATRLAGRVGLGAVLVCAVVAGTRGSRR
jgi:adenosylcobinamide-phosphate synthase